MKRVAKKIGKTAADMAKAVAKQATQEIIEIPKQAGKELVGVKTAQTSDQPSAIVEAMQQRAADDVSPEELKKKKIEGIKRVQRLEEEIEKQRKEREEKVKSGLQPEASKEGEAEVIVSEPGKPILPSTGRPPRGVPQMGKAKTPETRKSRH